MEIPSKTSHAPTRRHFAIAPRRHHLRRRHPSCSATPSSSSCPRLTLGRIRPPTPPSSAAPSRLASAPSPSPAPDQIHHQYPTKKHLLRLPLSPSLQCVTGWASAPRRVFELRVGTSIPTGLHSERQLRPRMDPRQGAPMEEENPACV